MKLSERKHNQKGIDQKDWSEVWFLGFSGVLSHLVGEASHLRAAWVPGESMWLREHAVPHLAATTSVLQLQHFKRLIVLRILGVVVGGNEHLCFLLGVNDCWGLRS